MPAGPVVSTIGPVFLLAEGSPGPSAALLTLPPLLLHQCHTARKKTAAEPVGSAAVLGAGWSVGYGLLMSLESRDLVRAALFL